MKVKLTYFKKSGKFYTDSEYDTSLKYAFEVYEEVKEMKENKNLPGLSSSGSEFIIYIDLPEHEYNVPALIMWDSL